MLAQYASATNAENLASVLDSIPLNDNPLLLDDGVLPSSKEGKESFHRVKARENQWAFRKLVLLNYSGCCCLTGLPVQQVLEASHISPWETDVKNRMNLENGLCLSATYHTAFDRYLISFDEDYRLVLSSSLQDLCSNEAFAKQFSSLKGQRLCFPSKFTPSQVFLARHRDNLVS